VGELEKMRQAKDAVIEGLKKQRDKLAQKGGQNYSSYLYPCELAQKSQFIQRYHDLKVVACDSPSLVK
jgi:hypothetical protein